MDGSGMGARNCIMHFKKEHEKQLIGQNKERMMPYVTKLNTNYNFFTVY